jgi:ubiquitin C-terminal hydrolase
MRTTNPGTEFRWDKQQDVPEVLEVLIAAINEASLPARKISEVVVRSTVICTVCSYSSSVDSIQPIMWMNIKQSLPKMIEDFETDEILDGATAYMCSRCNRRQKALRRAVIVRCPEMLVVAMRRFKRTEQGSFVRNRQKVDLLPPLNVPVRPEIDVEFVTTYNVSAIIHHEGSHPNRGHYYADIRRHNKWFHCNDRAVTPSNISDLGNDTSYVVFFKRQGIQRTITHF